MQSKIRIFGFLKCGLLPWTSKTRPGNAKILAMQGPAFQESIAGSLRF